MVDNIPIKDMSDWERVVADMKPNRTYTLRTENGPKSFYRISTRFKTEETPTGRLINMTESVVKEFKVNGSLVNRTVNQTVKVNETRTVYLGMEDMGLRVYEAPTNNLRKGLDIQGGTRVLLQPETQITSDEMGLLIDSLKERLNVFGLSDVIVREASDLSGNQYVLVEIAGANEEEVKELLAKQGKFEARIANQTVFRGGTDITYVCRTAQCSGLDSKGWLRPDPGWLCMQIPVRHISESRCRPASG